MATEKKEAIAYQEETTEKLAVKKPDKYAVVIMNDDFTPMEFVVWVIQNVFHRTLEESHQIMLKAHTTGKAICGVYTYDIARTRLFQVIKYAEEHSHPLECKLEAVKEDS